MEIYPQYDLILHAPILLIEAFIHVLIKTLKSKNK